MTDLWGTVSVIILAAFFCLCIAAASGCTRSDVDYSDYGAQPVNVTLTIENQTALYQMVNQCEAYCINVKTVNKNSKCQLFCIKATLANGGSL